MNRKLVEYLPFIQKYLYTILRAGIDVRGFVVYGSIVSEEMTKTSDIDIKIFVSKKTNIKQIEEIEREINKEIIKSKFTNLLHSIISMNPDPEHIEEGILLYGKPIEIKIDKENLSELFIITYDTTSLDKNRRVKFAIRLFGHEIKRKVKNKIKVYRTEGVLNIYSGKALRNAILINTKDSTFIEQILKDFGTEYKIARVYMPKFSVFLERQPRKH